MAGRIPQAFIDDLLERVDIVDIVDRRVKLRRSGKNYSGLCPFHDEKSPSFTVNPEKQFYYCFGCGAGGNALGFVMEYDNLDFPAAVEQLAADQGLEVPREESRGQPRENHQPLLELLARVDSFFQQSLRTHREAARAVDYLRQRGVTGTVARDFGLGFAPPGWDNLLEAFGGDAAITPLLEAGVVVRNESGRCYDRFRDRIVFPIRDRRGRTVAFGGRVLGDDKPKYLNSPESPVFHKGRELYGLFEATRANRRLERILVVEGYMDVIALAQHGVTWATATLGTATSQTHLERIFRLCSEVVFCFDGDAAGRGAALRALETTLPTLLDGRQARFLFLPEGEDPDSLVRAIGGERFAEQVRGAQPLEEFLFESQWEGIDPETLEGRARYARRVMPLLRRLPTGVFQELMQQDLARRTGLELESLLRLAPPEPEPAGARRAPAAGGPAPRQEPEPPLAEPPPGQAEGGNAARKRDAKRPPQGHANLSQAALALILHHPEIARLADPRRLEALEGPDVALLREVIALLKRRPESNTAMLLGHWYGTDEGALLGRLAGQERLIPEDGVERQFLDTLARLESLPRRSNLLAEVDKLKKADYAQMSADDKERLRELLKQKQLLDAERRTGA